MSWTGVGENQVSWGLVHGQNHQGQKKKNQGGRNDIGRPGKLLLVHRLNKAFGLKLLIFLF